MGAAIMLTIKEQAEVILGRIGRRLRQAKQAEELLAAALEDTEREMGELRLLLRGQAESEALNANAGSMGSPANRSTKRRSSKS